MSAIRERLRKFPRQSNSLLPTPLHRLERLSAELDAEIYCKRDDLTAFGFGGNKARKLDFLLADAKAQGADTLIALGANQSNFARMAAAMGRVNGMDSHLVLRGKKPLEPTGNLLLDRMLEAEITHVDTDDWAELIEESEALERELTAKGRKVYRMPLGGSTDIGALGYAAAFAEIMEDSKALGVCFDVIMHASSSGGTQAGLAAGKEIAGWPGRLIGVSVDPRREDLERKVAALAVDTGKLLGAEVRAENVEADDSYIGPGYAARTKECDEAVRIFAHRCGIFLDYVYSGKAAAGLIDYVRRGRIGKNANILFIHTGGNIELFE